jgi:hypothetical protein
MTRINASGILACAIVFGLLGVSPGLNAATVERNFSGNDCKGFFNPSGGGFDACTIFINNEGENIELSPVIAKYAYDDGARMPSEDDLNGSLYPSIDGSEFSITNTSGSGLYETADWSYTPGAGDPGVRYWAAKADDGFNLFWEVDAALTGAGGVCDAAGDVYNLDCLNAAQVLTSGSFSTPGNAALSHITFYDTEIIPIPAAAWLFGSALGLLGWMRRRLT